MGKMSGWHEVADSVFQRRYDPLDVSVCAIVGGTDLLLVDTRSSHRQADDIRRDLRELGPAAVRAVVNTHAHYDHSFGNYRFGPDSDLDVPIYGHELVPAHHETYEVPMLAARIERGDEPVEEWREVVITAPTHLVGAHTALHVGDRLVELHHLGRGHTDNDLLLHVVDADAWLVGDLVEESGPPMYGSGSFPLDWPLTIDALRPRLSDGSVVVPGHGAPVDRRFVQEQQRDLRTVAETIEALFAAGVSAEAALHEGKSHWPFPVDGLASAVRDGYRQLQEGPHADT